MIEMNGVNMTYEAGNRALRDINIRIEDGEFVFIMGRSGSGKSTLLKLLLKEAEPTSGRIVVNDMDLQRMRRRHVPRYRRTLGVVFQDFRLLGDRNVFENVAFAQRVIGVSARTIRGTVPRMLKMVGLSAKYKSLPHQLSGGEQQRVSIARALAKNPKLLLCDEPTGALDYQTGKTILQLLQDTCRKRGMTVVVITHNSALAPMADRVFKIKNGQISSMRMNETPVSVEEIEW